MHSHSYISINVICMRVCYKTGRSGVNILFYTGTEWLT